MPTETRSEVQVGTEQRFRQLIEAVSDYAIYMLDVNGVITTWNTGAQRFKGYTEAEILGQHFSKFYTDEDRQAGLPARALEITAREGRFEQEGWRVRKDGERIWAHVVIDAIRDEAGALVGFAKITRDVTDQRKAREELRLSEERFRLLVQGISDYAIYMLDPLGYVTNWNTGAQRFKGYTESEIVGQHFSRFYPEEDRASGLPSRALETAMREGRFENEGWRVRKDGTRMWAHVIIDAIRDAAGELIGFAKVTRDITEKREAQLALDQARATLFQAQKMETIGQLTGGIAHDFNNLLAVILGNLELARKRIPDDSSVRQLIDNSIQATQRGSALTQRMLSFARRQELKTGPVDIPTLVRNIADLLQRAIGPTTEINTQFPLRLRSAFADSNQLELALLNLVVNARDAMPDGGVITIRARTENVGAGHPTDLDAGSYVCVAVTDTGAGMDETTLARAVEPFFTTKGIGKGTGLGLSMVHGFAEQSGGRLVLKSAVGRGTTAEIWLPVADEHDVTAPENGREPDHPDRSQRPLSVLVVDDDPLVLANTAAMLEDVGHTVFEATSGEQALRVLRRASKVDILITDQLMPGMLGTQLIAAVLSEWPDLPIILATGYAELASDNALDVQRLAKPFMQADLTKAVSEVLQSKDPGRVIPFRTR